MARKSKASLYRVLPHWTAQNANVNTELFLSCLGSLGIYDFSSYRKRFPKTILFCVFIGACIGLSHGGFKGIFIGGAMGFATPAAAIWLGITLAHMAIYLFAYMAAWAVILYIGYWFLNVIFGG